MPVRVTDSVIKEVVKDYATSHLITFGADMLGDEDITITREGATFGDELDGFSKLPLRFPGPFQIDKHPWRRHDLERYNSDEIGIRRGRWNMKILKYKLRDQRGVVFDPGCYCLIGITCICGPGLGRWKCFGGQK